ncbi:two-partner secretion domain-containing protein [Yersinia massiliensis]|uniref:two-partner secretion domain-containing protein n=1 Tax=Yersinia massiliensis TaxID=419257 RepID=UPI00030C4678|nr:filamentous hemagglutinin N-terminal domain-containing protein [Yersinia massiliensis]
MNISDGRQLWRGHVVATDKISIATMNSRNFNLAAALTIALLPGFPVCAEDTLPTISSTVSGAVQISQSGKNMQIDTSSARTVIDWKDFSIGADNKVHFRQPDGSSITLNRVVGKDPSKIFGVLTSNGQLVLLNPNGIWVGPNAKINTQSLAAGAAMVTEEQLKKFEQSGKLDIAITGMLKNEGTLTSAESGTITLLGAQVENNGVIKAHKGTVRLATGPAATLDFQGDGLINLTINGAPAESNSVNSGLTGGVHNSGQIDVGSGVVAMSAQRAAKHLDSVINLGGAVIADSVSEQGGSIILGNAEQSIISGKLSAKGTQGGNITLFGNNVVLTSSANIDASGTQTAGGKILVGGDYQGKGTMSRADKTIVNKGAVLKAEGKTNGGTIVAWGDKQTHFAGSASVKGDVRGGLVETSGQQLNVTSDANIDVSGGEIAGKWLLDPKNLTVSDTGSMVIPDVNDTNNWTVSNQAIINALQQRGTVEITATERIDINAPIVVKNVFKDANSSATLSIISSGNPTQGKNYAGTDLEEKSGSIYINAPIILQGGNLFIAATGDVVFKDNAGSETGDAAWNKRAIVDLGSGIAWIKTSNAGSIRQDANTALKAAQVALEGASVRMDSELNYAGKLAGRASNGIFTYSQTNASGTTLYGPGVTINSPIIGSNESMTGITSQQLILVGEQTVSAVSGKMDANVTLKSNEQFDYLVFTAVDYNVIDKNGNSVTLSTQQLIDFLDSSDYLLGGLEFTDSNGDKWVIKPNISNANLSDVTLNDVPVASLPVGFSFGANNGSHVAFEFNNTASWGVIPYQGQDIPGAKLNQEIQYNPIDQQSQQLIINLGVKTDTVRANLGFLMDDVQWVNDANKNPDGYRNLFEQAKVYMLSSTQNPEGSINIATYQAKVKVNTEDTTRVYGEANPGVVEVRSNNEQMNKIIDVDNFIARQLDNSGRNEFTIQYSLPDINENVGKYNIFNLVEGGSEVNSRFSVDVDKTVMSITPADLVVVADSVKKNVGDADPALTYSIDNKYWKFAGDQKNVTLGREAGESVGKYSINTLTHEISANYRVVLVDGELRIEGPLDSELPLPQLPVPPKTDSGHPAVLPGTNPIILSGGSSAERCTTTESPSSIFASDTASAAIVRAYSVHLICKPRSYGTEQDSFPTQEEVIGYIKNLVIEGKLDLPDWNRTLIPRVHQVEQNSRED